jgi:hypothetical protein
MITKLIATLFTLCVSLNVLSAPIAADCLTHSGMANESVSNQCIHDGAETLGAKDHQNYAEKIEQETPVHIHLSKRSPSLAESLMAIFFIPGLILLWFSRFTKSNK